MTVDPHNPYPVTIAFVDKPGQDIPLPYASAAEIALQPQVSTEATQRIGVEKVIVFNTADAQKDPDGALLDIGERVGITTVFGMDENPGFPTDKIDSRRQGTSVTTLNQFDKILFPLLRGSDNQLVHGTPFIDFSSRIEAYGQSKLFHNPEYDSAKYAFTDIEGSVNPVTYIRVGGYYPAYPIVLDLAVYKDPDQLDGVIEVFDVRRSFSNTSIADYSFMKGVHVSLEGGYLNNRKGTAQIQSKFSNDPPLAIDYFEDSQDLFFAPFNFPSSSLSEPGIELRKFSPPGIVSTAEYILPPYSDSVDYTSGSYDAFETIISSHAYRNYSLLYDWLLLMLDGSRSASDYSYSSSHYLTAWWRFDTDISSAGSVTDLSGRGHTLTPPSDPADRPTYDAGDFPSQYISPGGGTCKFLDVHTLQAPDSADFSFTTGTADTSFSITCWIKLDPETALTRYIVAKYNSSSQREWYLSIKGSDIIRLELYDETNNDYSRTETDEDVPELEWVHLAVTYDGTAALAAGSVSNTGVKLFINGNEQLSTYTTDAGYVCMRNTTSNLSIANRDNESASYEFDGNIAEIAIWNKVLAEKEIVGLYSGSLNNNLGTNAYISSIAELLNGDNIEGPYSKMSAVGTRFKSATCGLQFGESNVLGTDSIAFGGLKK